MIEIRVSGENAGEILEQLTGLVAGALPTDTSWTPDEYPAIKKTESKKKIVEKPKKKAAPEPKKETSKETKAPEKSEPAADAVDKATMQKKMKQLLDSGHRDELFAIFKEHGAKKLSEVDSSQYGVIYDQMEAVK